MKENVDVAIIMGSDSDLSVMQNAAKVLEDFGVSYEITILSVHRCPEEAAKYAQSLKDRKVKVIIAGAGGAAHLPGVFAAQVPAPVIGVPIHSALDGIDSLYSIVQMPSGIPVATVAVDGAKNAGILAATILATSNDELRNKIIDYKKSMETAVLNKNEKLQKLGYKEYLNQM